MPFYWKTIKKAINYALKACEEEEHRISIQRFAGILANQLVEQAKKLGGPLQRFRPEESAISNISNEPSGQQRSSCAAANNKHHGVAQYGINCVESFRLCNACGDRD